MNGFGNSRNRSERKRDIFFKCSFAVTLPVGTGSLQNDNFFITAGADTSTILSDVCTIGPPCQRSPKTPEKIIEEISKSRPKSKYPVYDGLFDRVSRMRLRMMMVDLPVKDRSTVVVCATRLAELEKLPEYGDKWMHLWRTFQANNYAGVIAEKLGLRPSFLSIERATSMLVRQCSDIIPNDPIHFVLRNGMDRNDEHVFKLLSEVRRATLENENGSLLNGLRPLLLCEQNLSLLVLWCGALLKVDNIVAEHPEVLNSADEVKCFITHAVAVVTTAEFFDVNLGKVACKKPLADALAAVILFRGTDWTSFQEQVEEPLRDLCFNLNPNICLDKKTVTLKGLDDSKNEMGRIAKKIPTDKITKFAVAYCSREINSL